MRPHLAFAFVALAAVCLVCSAAEGFKASSILKYYYVYGYRNGYHHGMLLGSQNKTSPWQRYQPQWNAKNMTMTYLLFGIKHGFTAGYAKGLRYNGLRVTANQKAYIEYWLNKGGVKDYLRLANTLLVPFVKHQHISVAIIVHNNGGLTEVIDSKLDQVLENMKQSLDVWFSKLWRYNGFPEKRDVEVKLFGLVLLDGIEYVGEKYKDYPMKKASSDDTDANDISPFGAECSWFNKSFEKEACTLQHPEGLKMHNYALNMWTSSGATAIPPKMNAHPNVPFATMTHEFGHSMYLDDLYDYDKYPRPLPSGETLKEPGKESIMNAASELTDMDHAMIRAVWDIQSTDTRAYTAESGSPWWSFWREKKLHGKT
nr:Gametolysin peptidase domain-containing protein [Oceanusvirus sp.]